MNTISKHIALTLKTLRHDKGWSLDKTAQETGVSKAMLGQIEREESSPSIAILWKIASGFHTSFSTFLDDFVTDPNRPVFGPQRPKNISPHDEKIRITSLFPFDIHLHCEIFLIELLPSCEHLSAPHESGVIEHIIVVEGMMEILLEGVWQTLSKGEAIRFNANQPHGYRNTTKNIACFHNIIHYPKAIIRENLNP